MERGRGERNRTFAVPGTYVIAVGAYASLDPMPNGARYRLHISLDGGKAWTRFMTGK